MWQSVPADVPSAHNRRSIVAVGADTGSRTHRSFIAPSILLRAGQPVSGTPAPWRDPFGSCERAVCARSRVDDHPTCTGWTMNRQRHRRSFVGVNRTRRIRPMHAASQLNRTDRRPPPGPPAEEAALALLSDILIGERAWTLPEVQRLISMREAAELGRWRVVESHDDGTDAP